MSIEGFLVSLVVAVVAFALIVLPLIRRNDPTKVEELVLQKNRERLLVHYERVLSTLRDLDDDYAAQKIHPEEYKKEREYWAQIGVQVLQAIEEFDGKATHYAPITDETVFTDREKSIDDAIEAAVAKRLSSIGDVQETR